MGKAGPRRTTSHQAGVQPWQAGRQTGTIRQARGPVQLHNRTWAEQAKHRRRGVPHLGLGGRHRHRHRRSVHRHLLLERYSMCGTQRRMDVQQSIPELLILQGGCLMLQGGRVRSQVLARYPTAQCCC